MRINFNRILQKADKKLINAIIGGTLILLVIMGIGRFAYTPIFPLMQQELFFTIQQAGYLASINYLGYLLGALLASVISWKDRKTFFLRVSLILSILATMLMGLSEHFLLWLFLRFLAGLTSGLAFVLVSSIIMDLLASRQMPMLSGVFYSGVGIGIFLSGTLVPLLNLWAGWQGAWIGLGLLSTIFTLISWNKVVEEKNTVYQSIEIIPLKTDRTIPLFNLILAYTSQGLGYIITGTFLVAITMENAKGLADFPSLPWAVVGLAAAPSCIIWSMAAKRWGRTTSLIVAFLLQAIGIVLPIIFKNIFGTLLGGLLFGGTFMGIVTLVMSAARDMYPEESNRLIGALTFTYGLGQIFGPVIAGWLTTKTGNYNLALIFASTTLVFGAFTLAIGNKKEGRYPRPSVS